MNDLKQKILTAVDDDLNDIEKALTDNLTPYLELVSEVAGHLLFSGGKRLRPLLMVLSARLCGYTGDYEKTFIGTVASWRLSFLVLFSPQSGKKHTP